MSLAAFQSERLRARSVAKLSPTDRAQLLAPEVVQWLPEGFHGLETDADRATHLQRLAQQAEVVALTNEEERATGLLILSHPDEGGNTRHLGYLFAEWAWGRGYASEMLRTLQQSLRGQDVVLSGGVMEANAASARVLQKAGFVAQRAAGKGETVYTWSAWSA